MSTMRAKMRVTGINKYPGDGPTQSIRLSLTAVGKSDCYPPDGTDENNDYARWTPSAEVKMSIQNPALFDAFSPDQQFYVDFTPA